MKTILASVFLVLAVIAAVGIFGVQTSNRAEATTSIAATVNAGNGVPNIDIVVGRSYTIDLSQFVTTSSDATASTTYHLVTTRGYIYDPDDLPAYGYPAGDAGNTTRLHDSFRAAAACTAAATTCAAANAPALRFELNENTGLLKITPNPTGRGSGVHSAGQLHWVADSTPADNDPATQLPSGANPAVPRFDTLVNRTADVANADAFTITSTAAPTTGAGLMSPAAGATVPTTFFPTEAQKDDTTPYDSPSWRGAALLGGSAPSDHAGTGETVTWKVNTLPAVPAAYVLAAHSSNTAVATVQASAQEVVISPLTRGTTTITLDVIPTSLQIGSTLATRTATTDKWRITRTFTVGAPPDAPPIQIYYDANGNDMPDTDDPKGDSASSPIVLTTVSGASGRINDLKTNSSSAADAPTYNNRDVRWRLAETNGASVIRSFRIRNVGLTNESQTSVGELQVAPGVTLPAGSTYDIKVIAQDHIAGSAGPPVVQQGNLDEAFVRVTVAQGNRPPVLRAFPSPAVTIPETASVGDMILDLDAFASDPDGQEITFMLFEKDGATPAEDLGDKVTLDAASNEIRLAERVDYEDVDDDGNTDEEDTAEERAALGFDRDAVRWRGTVSASDGILTVEQKIAFVVSDGSEAPVGPVPGTEFSVPENTVAGTEIGTVELDPTTAGADKIKSGFTPSDTVNAGGKFVLDGATGKLTVADTVTEAAPLDYEATDGIRRYLLLVTATGAKDSVITINVTDVNEAPELQFGDYPAEDAAGDDIEEYVAQISESADLGDAVAVSSVQEPVSTTQNRPNAPFAAATDEDAGDVLSYSLVSANADGTISDPETAFSGPFTINASTGAITVSGSLDKETQDSYVMHLKVSDDDATPMFDTAKLTITVMDANELPYFVSSSGSSTPLADVPQIMVDENTASPTVLATYYGYDPDGNDFEFVLRKSLDSDFFTLVPVANDTDSIRLTPKQGRTLDYEAKASYQVEIEIVDSQGAQGQILQTINLRNLNDNNPVWQQSHTALSTNENVARGTLLATYIATDADGDDITYSLSGTNGAHYQIGSADGMLKTLASLDAETNTSDSIRVTASDGSNSIGVDTRISIGDVADTIGSITVKMANPVLGTNGDPNSALADRKVTLSTRVPEAPADLPATTGNAVVNFVETAHANWGSVLRIEVLSVSPGSNCGNGNQCVVIELEGNDSDDVLNVMAYRNGNKDNLFVAAVMPVASANDATPGAAAVYKHTDGSVPRIKVDEEDTLRVKFGNLRDDVIIDNEAPEFANFLPEHEASTDDDEVDYSFTVTDAISGIPEPDDLPDADGDENYMAVAALVNSQQCHNVAAGASAPAGTSMVANTNLHEGARLYCPTATTPQVRVIVDDKDLDEVTDGYEVSTQVVLNQNEISYVTFIACDKAGNCAAFDPDENDTREALAEITVDTADPTLSEARTGVMWDAADNAYDDSRSFIQAIFNDLSKLNPDTIEADDFVVDGYTIKRVYWYDDPDEGDQNWGTRYDTGSRARTYQAISKTVFIELEEELLPDATPDVSVVPNGLEDAAGNEQDDDEVEADDWIAPKFTVTSIESPRTTTRDNVLVGEDEKVTITVTSDERISTTKPLVDVHSVNAPAGCVDRSGIILRVGRDTDGDGRLEPNERRDDCATSAKGSTLNSVISKDGTNEWTITVDKPSTTGYYNVHVYADDRSSQNNRGSEGVAPDNIVTDFFEKDGDVNADDAVFFEGDVQLPKPQVVVSGKQAGDTEPTVEFKRPLFIEVDFTEPFSADCSDGDKLDNEIECVSEGTEYAEDGFDTVTVTRFELNGVDMTDDVRTTDDETFLVALNDVSIGDHEIKIQAVDAAGNELKDVLEIEFEVEERDPFTRRLNPGWNLVSLPGQPEDSAIASVFGSDIEVRTVYTYNPVTPGGWQVAVRESLDDDWQGDLTDITAKSGYWVLSDAIQDLEVSIPRLAGGAVGASTPVQPPVIPMYAGWNLIPVVDVTGDALDTDKAINATTYLNSLDDGLDLARVLGFNTITNEWFTVIDPSDSSVTSDLQIGSAYWVFVRESASLVPGGIPR